MNKTVTANISGLIFNIDEGAYTLLKDYLKRIEKIFANSEGGDDIMADIEGRIAEMFSEKISDRKEVISRADVERMISVMGQPEDFMDEETKAEQADSSHEQHYEQNDSNSSQSNFEEDFEPGSKRFYRDPDNKIVGGVCSGIGYYFGVDPIIFRLLFVLAVIFGFSGILVYIIFWIVTPKAQTRAEKLQMRGKKVNIDNIRESVKNEAQNIKKNFGKFEKNVDDFASGSNGKRVESFLTSLLTFAGSIIMNILKFVAKFVGVILIIFGVIFLISLVLSLFGLQNFSGVFDINGHYLNISMPELTQLFLGNGWIDAALKVGIALTIGLPILFFILVGFKILHNQLKYGKIAGMTILFGWVTGIVLLFLGGSFLLSDFSEKDSVNHQIALSPTIADTLYVNINGDMLPVGADETYPNDFLNLLKIEDERIFLTNVKFNVIESNTDSIYVSVNKFARGNTSKEANLRADDIYFNYAITDNEIKFDPAFSISMNDKYRGQGVEVNLAIPQDKTVYLGENTGWIIYDIKNVTNTHDSKMTGKYWTLTSKGLDCLHCNFVKSDNGINYGEDLNELSITELKKLLNTSKRKLDLLNVEYEQKIEVHVSKIQRKMERFAKKIEETSNDEKIEEYTVRIKELEKEIQLFTLELEEELEDEMDDLEETIQEIETILQEKKSEENEPNDHSGIEHFNESSEETQNTFTKLSFPNPFIIL